MGVINGWGEHKLDKKYNALAILALILLLFLFVKTKLSAVQNKSLQVMLVDEGNSRTELLIVSLMNEGFEISGRVNCDDDLTKGIQKYNPDILLIDMEAPDEKIFEQLVVVSNECAKPVVFFADKGETAIINKAVKAGVGAFIVDGFTDRKLKPVIELSMARFNEMRMLHSELNETKNKLEERKIVERAKGILMDRKNISEETAYQSLRKLAMEQNKKIVDVARSTIELAELF